MKKSERRALTACYIILRAIVLIVMIDRIANRDWSSTFLCVLTLILFMIPSIFERRLKIDVPDTLEIIILMFIFLAEILGEIAEFYIRVPHWDTMLHTANGFLMAAIGVSMIDILNRDPRIRFNMSPVFEAFTAFCFSMTIGVVWEFFEYGMDVFFLTDMQKDTIISGISSVAINPEGVNVPIIVEGITRTVIEAASGDVVITGGYLDIGLNDTMKDMLVNLVGALVFSIIGVIYFRRRGRTATNLIPRPMSKEEVAARALELEEAKERFRKKHRIKKK